jgi:hypothetical protein
VTRAKVVEIIETQGMILVALQLISGEVEIGMILSDSTNQWRIAGTSTSTAEAWRTGRRGVVLRPSTNNAPPTLGAELFDV